MDLNLKTLALCFALVVHFVCAQVSRCSVNLTAPSRLEKEPCRTTEKTVFIISVDLGLSRYLQTMSLPLLEIVTVTDYFFSKSVSSYPGLILVE